MTPDEVEIAESLRLEQAAINDMIAETTIKDKTVIEQREEAIEASIKTAIREEFDDMKERIPSYNDNGSIRRRPIVKRIIEVVRPGSEQVVVVKEISNQLPVIDNPPPVIYPYYTNSPMVEPKEKEDFTTSIIDSSVLGSSPINTFSGSGPNHREKIESEPCNDGNCGCHDCGEKSKKRKKRLLLISSIVVVAVIAFVVYRLKLKK